jgi:hypothetical protein
LCLDSDAAERLTAAARLDCDSRKEMEATFAGPVTLHAIAASPPLRGSLPTNLLLLCNRKVAAQRR